MAREVTVQEFADWVEKNKRHTWNRDQPGSKRTMAMKYIRFSLDTRDMKIFSITTEGFNDLTVDFRDDEKDWSILDALQCSLDKLEPL